MTDDVLVCSITRQTLEHVRQGVLIKTYRCSTGLKEPSCKENSFGTPWGLHKVDEKIGDCAPVGTVFRGRVSIGRAWPELSEVEQKTNLVTTRILWLRGLEPELNAGPGCDSHERYIYIHGTNHEELLGQPASGGCIQLSNRDVVALFDAVASGTLVWIER